MEAYHKPRIVMLSTTKYLHRLYMLQTQIFRYNIHLKILLYFVHNKIASHFNLLDRLKSHVKYHKKFSLTRRVSRKFIVFVEFF